MADLKKRTLLLSSGKQIKLFGSSIAIAKSLEIGEGLAPNIFSCINEQTDPKPTAAVSNPYKLTMEEIMELADYNIQLWMDLKANIRKYGLNNSKIFNPHCNYPEKKAVFSRVSAFLISVRGTTNFLRVKGFGLYCRAV